MRVYFTNENGNTITEYYHIVPLIPICPIIELNTNDQSCSGTVTVDDVPFLTMTQEAHGGGSNYYYSSNITNLMYRFSSNSDTTHVIKAKVTVINEDHTTSVLNAVLTAYYKSTFCTIASVFGDFYNDGKYHTVKNNFFTKHRNTLTCLHQLLSSLKGSATLVPNNYTRYTQYIKHILEIYKHPYKDNGTYTLSDKVFYIHKDTSLNTTITAVDILKDASINTLIIDSVYSTNNCTVMLNRNNNVVESITVSPVNISIPNTSCILCIKDTVTNILMYINITFIQKFVSAYVDIGG